MTSSDALPLYKESLSPAKEHSGFFRVSPSHHCKISSRYFLLPRLTISIAVIHFSSENVPFRHFHIELLLRNVYTMIFGLIYIKVRLSKTNKSCIVNNYTWSEQRLDKKIIFFIRFPFFLMNILKNTPDCKNAEKLI